MIKKTLIIIFCICLVLGSSINVTSNIETNNLIKFDKISSYEDIVEMIEQVNESLVFYYFDKLMEFGSRYTGSENCTRAGQYIYNEFVEMGLDVEFHEWSFKGFDSRNVVATLEGVDPKSSAIMIFSAHYDCTPGSLGADDDGSGVAAVMAAAKIMSQYSFNHTIRFIAFSGEEVGLCGSFTYARDAYNKGDNIYAVLNADMIGYANSTYGGKIMRFFKVERSAWIVDFCQGVSEKYSDLFDMRTEGVPNYRGADHQAFIDYGYDAVFIAHHDGYPWANSPEDTPDHINHTYEIKATKFLLACLAELAYKPIDIQILIKHPREGWVHLFNKSLFEMNFGKRWARDLRATTIILGRANVCTKVISEEDIKFVIFCLDDKFIQWDSIPPYEWKIQGKHYPPIGKNKLKVYAYTNSGKVATDEMDIRIFTLEYQYR
jgi:hypothetical protein